MFGKFGRRDDRPRRPRTRTRRAPRTAPSRGGAGRGTSPAPRAAPAGRPRGCRPATSGSSSRIEQRRQVKQLIERVVDRRLAVRGVGIPEREGAGRDAVAEEQEARPERHRQVANEEHFREREDAGDRDRREHHARISQKPRRVFMERSKRHMTAKPGGSPSSAFSDLKRRPAALTNPGCRRLLNRRAARRRGAVAAARADRGGRLPDRAGRVGEEVPRAGRRRNRVRPRTVAGRPVGRTVAGRRRSRPCRSSRRVYRSWSPSRRRRGPG